MKEKIVLMDGHSILNRAFYGLPLLSNSEGLHTNAVYGFLNIMTRILEEEKPQYLAVAFDLHAPTFRHQMYPEYKGTRKGMPQELREQVPVIQEVLAAMRIAILSKEGYEADDILGTVAKQCEELGMDVTIVSGDRDLLQLATEQILVRIPKTKAGKTVVEDYYAKQVQETYQVSPAQIIELKALMGDTADNIPGVKGIGEKTASKIIGAFGTIEEAFAHIDEIKPNKAKESLRENYAMAQLSKKLATIDVHSPIAFCLADAKLENIYTPDAYVWCKRLEFKNLLPRFEDLARGAGADENTDMKLVTVEEFGQAEEIWEKARMAEQTGVAALWGSQGLVGMAIALEGEPLYFLPVYGFMTERYLNDQLERLFAQNHKIGVWDLKSMRKKIEILKREQIFDLKLAAYLLNPLKSQYTYDDIAKEWLGKQLQAQEEIVGTTKTIDLSAIPQEQAAMLASNQAYVCLRAMEPMESELRKTEMLDLFEQIEMPLVFTLDDMEKEGILVKAEELKTYGQKLQVRIEELETKIYEQAGERFNINSPKQLGVILFETMGMPGGKKTKTGYSTAAEVLEKLAPEYPFVADILEYRQLAKLKSTYADGLAAFIEEDGRIRSTFQQTITATGRISSTEPNLQNIPIRMELGRLIRKVFVPRPGFVFLDADYSQIELRVLAHMSGDEHLIQAYHEAEDIHRITASKVFGIPLDEVTPLQRRNAKAVNFGIVYGISSFGLSQDLSISRKEASDYIDQYFATYPKIQSYLDMQVEMAKKEGYVRTLFGRRRPVPELKSSNFMQRSFGERIAMNSPVQGTAADIIKIAMIRVHDALRKANLKSRLILQVHDELLIETAVDEVEEVSKLLEREMKEAVHLAVPLEIDMHTGENWYEAK